ncbi:RND superfamily putative drug exporter [Microbacteriaceae bacterium SG_E_30_P1]|uniref:RND superfamily putative drug exporter n=1 Tax=Antiquaquibacter oligotrophicus TaxID=2880260 RepID=A0ABT6KRM4_9MICO|nr:MMPL family transporter [Antiquaquibacter oligotrophicus]MDH6182123.1 RND superfamily putative drug exporter [Antiquaquibacter oligotrophicus]UDF12214.1 MMPL family transporter [Antiquaquibacter oligotrophicus]
MAELLHRIGTFAARRAWIVIGAWLGVIALAGGGFAIGFGGIVTNFDIPNTESSAVIQELEQELPDYAGASGTVVFHSESGEFSAEQREAISALAADADGLPNVSQVIDPFATTAEREAQLAELADGQAQVDAALAQVEQFGLPVPAELEAQAEQLALGAELAELSAPIRLVSEDGATAVVNVGFDVTRLELPDESKRAVVEHFESEAIPGVEVAFSTEIAQGIPQIFGIGEAIGLLIAGIVLLVMLGSIIAAAFPIITAIVGVAVGVLASLSFSGIVEMASVTPVLGVMLGLAVGIDYSLFIINRHRKQLRQGADVVESIGLANGTAGNAVVFAGSTVIVALLALMVTGIPFLSVMGVVGAVCVAVAVLLAVTLTPALLGLLGERLLSKRARAALADAPATAAVKPQSLARSLVTILVTVAALVTVALPAASMRLGLPDGSSEPVESASYIAHTLTAEAFGEGANSTLLVTAQLPDGTEDDAVLGLQAEVAGAIADEPDVVAVAPIDVSSDNRLAAFQIIPVDGPNSSSTEELVRELRSLDPLGEGVLGVAGQAAINIDISESLAAVLPIYLTVVVGLSLVIMIIVFRSLLVPLIATGGFILSLFATYGALVAVFQWGWLAPVFGIHSTGPILSFLPILLVGILFGLAMDYQLFLATGMREAFVHGAPARLAVAQGFRAGRAVVIAAGAIMVSVFGGFVFSESVIVRALGFGLAFGVLVDAFIVRMLLMPAIMNLLGRAAWWLPGWLDRIIPNVDVEGSALERQHPLH